MAEPGDLSSDRKVHNLSALDADVEDNSNTGTSPRLTEKRKNKRHKKKKRSVAKVAGDANQDGSSDSDIEPNNVNANGFPEDRFKKHAGEPSSAPATNTSGPSAVATDSVDQLAKAVKRIELQGQSRDTSLPSAPKSLSDAQKKTYKFWDTQPVPKLDDKIRRENCEIEADKEISSLRQVPYALPDGFRWDTLDLKNGPVLQELYQLLNENYVEDDDNMFRFDYSADFLRWALMPTGWRRDWHCGVRVIKSGKLVGFISAVPALIKIYDKYSILVAAIRRKAMVEINFLCVHKRLRSKRMAPVLIKEITRRVNLTGLFQAVYTAGVVLPKPVGTCRYWHRSLNPKKLIECRFSHLGRNMTMQRTLKLYRLPQEMQTPGFRKMTASDVPHTFTLLKEYLDSFDLAPMFGEEEFQHWFLPRTDIVDSFVVEKDGKITDFVSFYTLPSSVMNHPTHKKLKAAYSFYNVSTATPWIDLMRDALIVAKNMDFDVFNALDLMQNKTFLEPLKFGIGDGNLQYYLYNWKCPSIETERIGLVLQ